MNSSIQPHTSPLLDRFRSDGWLRDIDVQLVASLLRVFADGASPPGEIIQLVLALAVNATADGHVCLDLNPPDWPQLAYFRPRHDSTRFLEAPSPLEQLPTPRETSKLLLSCPSLVGDGSGPQPFVFERNRLYLRRFWNYENLVARKLLQMANSVLCIADPDLLGSIDSFAPLPSLPGGKTLHLAPAQVQAVRLGLQRQLAIVTGGPGTGKTTVAAILLHALARLNQGPALRVRLAAPTGKAAARLEESVRRGIGGNVASLNLESASTIDRLLGYRPHSPYFFHNRENPLPADVVLVDEASMVDLPKMAKLLDALGNHTRLVLLGDKNQLASVDPGSVMAEICDSKALESCVVELTESKRFADDSSVKRLSVAINEMRANDAWCAAHSDSGDNNNAISVRNSANFDPKNPPAAFRDEIRRRYGPYVLSKTPQDAFAALSRFRVLCALRQGPTGSASVNAAIENILFPSRNAEHYDHRAILVTQNDYEINLFNGDVGVLLPDPGRNGDLAAFFEGRPHSVPCRLLPEHETAFAMTVHKSQGSGFAHAMVLLPDRDSVILTRELVYTAITRTESGIDLWCGENAFKAAVSRQTERRMGLREKLDFIANSAVSLQTLA